MRLLIKMAVRNVVRYKRRSILTGLSISLGFAMLIFSIGISEGSYHRIVDTAAKSGAGHVLIQPLEFDLLDPQSIPDPHATLGVVNAIPGARPMTRTQALALATTAEGAATLMVMGIDPATEKEVSLFAEALVEGEWLPDVPGRIPKALLGADIARRLNVGLGDRVVLTAQAQGEMSAELVRVHGVFSSGSEEIDAGMVLVHQQVVQALLKQPDAIHQIPILLENMSQADAVADTLQKNLPNLAVLTWAEALPEIGDWVAMDRKSASLMFIFLFAIVGLSVLNAVLMSVLERIKEFGVMLAIGMQPRILFGTVLLEALILSTVSIALGGALGWAIVAKLQQTGLDLAALSGMEEMELGGFEMAGMIYPTLPADRVIAGVFWVMVLTVSGTLYAAWRAARIAPVEALRHD
jgi:ABC-type lipoprotein release transport system permease subunit